MIINDKVYGRFEIKEKVIVSLLKDPAVKRLKNISQNGLPQKYWPVKTYSRYEHSIGVMLLLRKLGASLEEQVAGLLHDISHTAFSHIGDIALSDSYLKGKETYHEISKARILKKTTIPTILIKFGFNPKKIFDLNNFSLVDSDNEADLCADRIDYVLREFGTFLKVRVGNRLVNGLANYNNRIVFKNEKEALTFSEGFLELQKNYWGAQELNIRYFYFADILKNAMKKKIIRKVDIIYRSEEFILDKLLGSKDNDIMKSIARMDRKNVLKPYLNRVMTKKFRHSDPEILTNDGPKRLSTLNKGFKILLEKEKKANSRGVKI